MLDKTDQQIAAILEKLSKLADVHGDEAVRLAVEVAHREAISTLFLGGALLAIAASIYILARWPLRSGFSAWNARQSDYSDDGGLRIGAGIAGMVASTAVLIAAITQFASYWAWVGISNPKLYLAHKIMDKLL